ncbi:hypothetical protein ACS2BX_26085 [Bacillus cereus group sp. BceL300]|nr:hypothetical protein [Bacillus cereus]MDK7480942.1 hypothetical protein [Bacillus cereus]NKX14872.1 hypothetical protein [Bacillus cereus]HDR8003403.1 hypothetical protein [Bacillus cereus]HDR8014949.1 hypothetical protein [Bacillus cereus]
MRLEKLSSTEIEIVSNIAAKIFDNLDPSESIKLTSRQAFILGMLHGREHALNEIGIFDDEDDDSKLYEQIKKNRE